MNGEGITRAQFLTARSRRDLPHRPCRERCLASAIVRSDPTAGWGNEVADGETPYTSYNAQRMRHDLWTIRYALWASSVSVFRRVSSGHATAERRKQTRPAYLAQPDWATAPRVRSWSISPRTGKEAERLRGREPGSISASLRIVLLRT